MAWGHAIVSVSLHLSCFEQKLLALLMSRSLTADLSVISPSPMPSWYKSRSLRVPLDLCYAADLSCFLVWSSWVHIWVHISTLTMTRKLSLLLLSLCLLCEFCLVLLLINCSYAEQKLKPIFSIAPSCFPSIFHPLSFPSVYSLSLSLDQV